MICLNKRTAMTLNNFFKRVVSRKVVLLGVGCAVLCTAAVGQTFVVASTTSTQQSGLFAHLMPQFEKATGMQAKVVAVGTGQAIDMGRRGDADVLFVHDKVAEEKVVAEGHAVKRFEVMYNDFVLIGPKADPVKARGNDVVAGLKRIAAANAGFISRGDKSGTHAAELRFWKMADLSDKAGAGYKACGCGMGPALNMAASTGAYVLADRGTWLNFKNKGNLAVLVEGDKRLFNQYGVMLVHPAKHPNVKVKEGEAFIAWLTGAAGQGAIAAYRIAGEQLFFPNASP